MLREFRCFDFLGCPVFFFDVFSNLQEKGALKYSDITGLYFNRVICGKSNFSGCIKLALKLQLFLSDGELIYINPSIKAYLNSFDSVRKVVVLKFFDYIMKDEEFVSLITSDSVRFDSYTKKIQISSSAFELKYANIKHFLLDFGVLLDHPSLSTGVYLFSDDYKSIFEEYIIPAVHKRTLSVDELNRSLELQKLYGEQAEKFVFEFEKRRLQGKDVFWVAKYVVNQGYDIASFNCSTDDILNKFIEVKSYDSGKPYFYLTKNERLVANYKKDEYWLYLVDRNKIGQNGYEPLMIQNPLVALDNSSEWFVEIETLKYSYL
jgi:hypothetical protein